MSGVLNPDAVIIAKNVDPAKLSVAAKSLVAGLGPDVNVEMFLIHSARRVVSAEKKSAPAPTTGRKTKTMAGRARELINGGKTNAQIWPVMQKEFGLDDDRRNYIFGYIAGQRRFVAARASA